MSVIHIRVLTNDVILPPANVPIHQKIHSSKMLALFCSRITETERKIYVPPSFSMTLVVEYQYRVYKIGSILGKK